MEKGDIEKRYVGMKDGDFDDEVDFDEEDEYNDNIPENLKKHKIKVRSD